MVATGLLLRGGNIQGLSKVVWEENFAGRSLKGLAAGGGPELVGRQTRKRPAADQSRDEAETRGPLGLTLPTAVESVWFAYAGEAAGGTPRPKVQITNKATHSPFPFGSSGEVGEFKYLGLGLREGKEKQKEIERRGAKAERQTYTPA